MKCAKCGGNNIWIQDHSFNDGKPLNKSDGGCSQK